MHFLPLCPEDGCSTFLRIVGPVLPKTRRHIQVPTVQCLKIRIHSAARPIQEQTTVLAIAVFSYPMNRDGGGINLLSNVGVILLELTALCALTQQSL